MMGYHNSIYNSVWPKFDPSKLVQSEMSIPVMINGKLRDVLKVKSSITEQEIIDLVKQQPKITKFIGDKPIKKILYVKNKIVNILI